MNRVAKVNSKIPVMLQDCFLGESYWSPLFNSSANLVIDSHIYFFAASGIYADYVAGKFKCFVLALLVTANWET